MKKAPSCAENDIFRLIKHKKTIKLEEIMGLSGHTAGECRAAILSLMADGEIKLENEIVSIRE